jgi:hypothetical protein
MRIRSYDKALVAEVTPAESIECIDKTMPRSDPFVFITAVILAMIVVSDTQEVEPMPVPEMRVVEDMAPRRLPKERRVREVAAVVGMFTRGPPKPPPTLARSKVYIQLAVAPTRAGKASAEAVTTTSREVRVAVADPSNQVGMRRHTTEVEDTHVLAAAPVRPRRTAALERARPPCSEPR